MSILKTGDGITALVMYYDIVVIADDTMEIVEDTLMIYYDTLEIYYDTLVMYNFSVLWLVNSERDLGMMYFDGKG